MKYTSSFLSGALFSAGLVISGMTRPDKVLAFLDVTGNFDPTLLAVMGGALVTHRLGYLLVRKRAKPLLAEGFHLPTRGDVDLRLALGAVLFGVGWGLSGYCPGPAVTSLAAPSPGLLLFFSSLLLGMVLHGLLAGRFRSLWCRNETSSHAERDSQDDTEPAASTPPL